MTRSTLARYGNLFRNVANWPLYFREKFGKRFSPVVFRLRGSPVRIEVASHPLYLVFKEIFVSDFYSIGELTKALPPDATVIDVGANAGLFSMLMLARFPRARVIACEPIAENCGLLRRNIALNPSVRGQIEVHEAAVTGHPAESVRLFRENAHDPSVVASVFQEFSPEDREPVVVAAITLEQILSTHRLARVDLLKLDCEGSEYPIVYDTPAAVWPAIHAMVLEVHDLDGDTRNVAALTRRLEQLGYRCRAERAANGCSALFAQRA
jgi:FkbM family methyltransferase